MHPLRSNDRVSESHIDPVRSSLPPETLQSLRSAFSGITELHLGHAGITWQEVSFRKRHGSTIPQMLDLEAVLPNLEALYLNDNRCISRLRSETVAGWAFSKLRTLSLDGCGVESWEEVAAGLGHLESLVQVPLKYMQLIRVDQIGTVESLVESYAFHTASFCRTRILSDIRKPRPPHLPQYRSYQMVRYRRPRVLDVWLLEEPQILLDRVGSSHGISPGPISNIR